MFRIAEYLTALGLLGGLLLPASWLAALLAREETAVELMDSRVGLALVAAATFSLFAPAIVLAWAGRRRRRVGLVLALLFLLKGIHSLYWFLIWDSTTDPLGILWLPIPLFGAGLAGAYLLTLMPSRWKASGPAYTFLLVALILTVFVAAERADFRQLTEARAERLAGALARYETRHGRYPQQLGQLRPGTVLALGEPVVIFGEAWCYEGGDDYYRLGYVDREHWSSPNLISRVASAAGETPTAAPLCARAIAVIVERAGGFPYAYQREVGP